MMTTHLQEIFDHSIYSFQANIFIVITIIKIWISLDRFYSFYLFFFHFLRKKITSEGTKAERLSKRQP